MFWSAARIPGHGEVEVVLTRKLVLMSFELFNEA